MGLFYIFYVYVFAATILCLPTWLFVMAMLDRRPAVERRRSSARELRRPSALAFSRRVEI